MLSVIDKGIVSSIVPGDSVCILSAFLLCSCKQKLGWFLEKHVLFRVWFKDSVFPLRCRFSWSWTFGDECSGWNILSSSGCEHECFCDLSAVVFIRSVSAAQPCVINLLSNAAMNDLWPKCWAILLCWERACVWLLSPEIPQSSRSSHKFTSICQVKCRWISDMSTAL